MSILKVSYILLIYSSHECSKGNISVAITANYCCYITVILICCSDRNTFNLNMEFDYLKYEKMEK